MFVLYYIATGFQFYIVIIHTSKHCTQTSGIPRYFCKRGTRFSCTSLPFRSVPKWDWISCSWTLRKRPGIEAPKEHRILLVLLTEWNSCCTLKAKISTKTGYSNVRSRILNLLNINCRIDNMILLIHSTHAKQQQQQQQQQPQLSGKTWDTGRSCASCSCIASCCWDRAAASANSRLGLKHA